MDYRKMWNDLKEDMLQRSDREHRVGTKLEDYFLYASEVLRTMNRAEVEETKRSLDAERELDLAFTDSLFGNGGKKRG